MNNIKLIVVSVFCLSVAVPVFAQQETVCSDSATLKNVLSLALENNFQIRIRHNTAAIAANDNTYGNAGFMPTVGVSSRWNESFSDVKQKGFNDGEVREIDGQRSVLDFKGRLDWTLFDGMGMFVSKNQLNELQQIGEYNAKVTIDNTVASVSDLYYSLVVEQSKLDVLKEIVDWSAQRKVMVKDKYEVGRASYQEHLAAQVDYNTDLSALLRQENLLQSQRISLMSMLAVEAALDMVFTASDSLEMLSLITLDEVLSNSVSFNPQLLAAQRQQNVSYLEIKRIQAEQFPSLSFSTDYGYSNSTSTYGFAELSKELGFTYAFTLSWNAFDGFNTRRRKQNAKIAYENQQLELQEMKLLLRNDILTAYQNYINNRSLVELERDNLSISAQNASIAMERYRIGKSDFVEFRKVQNDYAEAANRYLNALYTVKLNENELLRLSGEVTRRLMLD